MQKLRARIHQTVCKRETPLLIILEWGFPHYTLTASTCIQAPMIASQKRGANQMLTHEWVQWVSSVPCASWECANISVLHWNHQKQNHDDWLFALCDDTVNTRLIGAKCGNNSAAKFTAKSLSIPRKVFPLQAFTYPHGKHLMRLKKSKQDGRQRQSERWKEKDKGGPMLALRFWCKPTWLFSVILSSNSWNSLESQNVTIFISNTYTTNDLFPFVLFVSFSRVASVICC